MGEEKNLEVSAIGSRKGFAVIKYAGVFDIIDLLSCIKTWYAKQYYNVAEKEHTEDVKSSGKELIFEFEGERKVTEYVKFKVLVKMNILRLLDVLVETPQGKEKLQQAEVDIGVRSWLVKNYKGTFKGKEKSKIHEFFRQIYEKFIGRATLDELKKKLILETLVLIDEIKTSLNVPRK